MAQRVQSSASGRTTNLSVRLASVRASRGDSLREVGDAAGLSKAYVHKLERGRALPSPATLRKLATALEVPYVELMKLAGHL